MNDNPKPESYAPEGGHMGITADPLERIAVLRAMNMKLWEELAYKAELPFESNKVEILTQALMRSKCKDTIRAIADNDERIASALRQL